MLHGSGKSALVATLLACTLTNIAASRGAWIDSDPLPGQFRQGYFEDALGRPGAVGLTLADQQEDLFFPNLTFDYKRTISLPPGTSAGVPLPENARYRISSGGEDWSPYVLIGPTVPVASTQTAGENHRATGIPPVQLDHPKRLRLSNEKLALLEWDGTRTFEQDRQLQREVEDRCTVPGAPPDLLIDVTEDTIAFEFGSCLLKVPAQGRRPGDWYVAAIAGADWLTVAREDEQFAVDSRLNIDSLSQFAALAVFIAAGMAFVFGLPTAAVVSVLLLAASFTLHPMLCVVVFILSGALAAVALPFAVISRLAPARPRRVRWMISAAVYGLLLVAVILTASPAERDEERESELRELKTEVISAPGACLLTGYSTANDVQVRIGTPGTASHLATDCAHCGGGVTRYARSGGVFERIEEFACAPYSPMESGTQLIFLGASNDDYILTGGSLLSAGWTAVGATYNTILRGLYYLQEPSSTRLRRLMSEAADRKARRLHEQEATIRRTTDCTERRGVQLWFFHDFTIMDLELGRTPSGARMLDARRKAVLDGGDQFVNVLEALGDEARISWFNDNIHLSMLGHRRVSELICDHLSR